MNPIHTLRTLAARLPLLGALSAPGRPSALDPRLSTLGLSLRPSASARWMLPSVAAITPQYIEMTLRGALAGDHAQAAELFDLMLDTWPELAGVCHELVEGVLARKLVCEPYHNDDEEPSPEAVHRCQVASAALRRMQPDATADENDLSGTIRDLMAGWFTGQVVLEVNWGAADGEGLLHQLQDTRLGVITAPRSTYWVHPACVAWTPEGRLGLRLDRIGPDLVNRKSKIVNGTASPRRSFSPTPSRPSEILPFPPGKFLVGIHKSKAGPVLGGALLRPLAWWWCAANFSADWLLNLAQLFGIPFRWVNYDPTLPEPLKNELDAMMQNFGSSGWARFPSGTELKFLEAGQNGAHSPQDALLDRCDRYARMLILGQTLSGAQDASKGGGKAFGTVEADVKSQRVDAACQYIATVFNAQLVPVILRLNFGSPGDAPVVRFQHDTEGDLADAQRDETLARAGLRIGVRYLRRKYGIPEPAAGEDTIGAENSGVRIQESEDRS